MKYLKEYLKNADKELLIKKCIEIDLERSFSNKLTDEENWLSAYKAYEMVYDKLVSFGEWTWFRKKYKLCFRYVDDVLSTDNSKKYIDVCLLNLDFEPFDTSLKVWGGKSDDKYDAPEGHVNINYRNHNKYFALGFMPWRVVVNLEMDIDSSIVTAIDSGEISTIQFLAETIYELTFNGYLESSYIKLKNELKSMSEDIESGKETLVDIEDAYQEIKDYIEDRSPTEKLNNKDGTKIKISKTALEDLKKIVSDE